MFKFYNNSGMHWCNRACETNVRTIQFLLLTSLLSMQWSVLQLTIFMPDGQEWKISLIQFTSTLQMNDAISWQSLRPSHTMPPVYCMYLLGEYCIYVNFPTDTTDTVNRENDITQFLNEESHSELTLSVFLCRASWLCLGIPNLFQCQMDCKYISISWD